MIQTGLIPNAHSDLVTDASYDFYGQRLATCSLDQRIKVWELDENNSWNVEDDWKAHDAAISKLNWAHPEFGSIIASASFDRTVKIWEQVSNPDVEHQHSSTRWVERAVLSDPKGTVRSVEFAPHHFGLKLAMISSDNTLRIYECVEQPALTSWQMVDELDVQTIVQGPSPGQLSRAQTMALATPTQTHGSLDGASASLVAQALQQGLQQSTNAAAQRQQMGNREADGGWCLSWCKDKYWGEVIAAGCGTNGIIKIIQINSRRSTTLLSLPANSNTATSTTSIPPPSQPQASSSGTGLQSEGSQPDLRASTPSGSSPSNAPTTAITSVSWAPSCGRSYHLIATGGRDGHVRIWKLKPGNDGLEDSENSDEEGGGGRDKDDSDGEGEDSKWTAVVVADFDHHRSVVGRVEWNITGTVLSSAGNDGRVRLWKATAGNVWRSAGSVGVEQADATASAKENKDVEMES
ncbi:WD40-repeat-containing domain protein [Crepidotus variabilis]|uniref:WD40-repeat-containing domain protein n=1 Tax=Crepidotus variabilis TaxID=179855 RepID=A0A9P6EEI0_9AGAR|nr:WD40-repeat-containing domain protein [Crepidotus variabilis]